MRSNTDATEDDARRCFAAARGRIPWSIEPLSIFQAAEVQLEQLTLVRWDEHAGDLWAFERGLDSLRAAGSDNHRDSLGVRRLQSAHVRDVVDDQQLP
jgi:hypothetical protein